MANYCKEGKMFCNVSRWIPYVVSLICAFKTSKFNLSKVNLGLSPLIPLGWDQLQLHWLSHAQPAHRGRESRRPQIGFILPQQRQWRLTRTDR